MYLSDMIALEDLNNNTICVKVEKGIRNIKEENDLILHQLVFVNNIIPVSIDEEHYYIKKYEYVRYKPLSIIIK